jgi:carbohydrate kinase (thermoresistant glucokinase family)
MRGHVPDLLFVYLDGSYDQIAARLTKRQAHFMPQTLLDSQFEALEPPTSDERALSVGIADSADQIVKTILDELADLGA